MMNAKRIKDTMLASPPDTPNGELQSAFWRGYAFEAGGAGQEFDPGPRRDAFEAGREHRRRRGPVPEAVRKALPALFASLH